VAAAEAAGGPAAAAADTATTPGAVPDGAQRPGVAGVIDVEEGAAGAVRPRRRRDPARKDRILTAAADLIANHGYHAVGMADIGAAAGIVGSGIYRHFDSKSALLAALLEQVMDSQERSAAEIVADAADDRDALERLVANHVRFAIEERRLLGVYYREAHHLPEEDLRRLRRAQRHYIEEWVIALAPLRRDLSDAELRVVVHSALGTTQAVLFHHSGLPVGRLAELLGEMGRSCLGLGTTGRSESE
jgi:AcrR family transcriptional regulator